MGRGSSEARGERAGGGRKVESDRVSVAQAPFPAGAFCASPSSRVPALGTLQPTWTPFCKTNALYWQNMAKKNFVSRTSLPPLLTLHTGTICASCLVASYPPSRTLMLRLDRNPPQFADRTWPDGSCDRYLCFDARSDCSRAPPSAHFELYHTYARGASADRFL